MTLDTVCALAVRATSLKDIASRSLTASWCMGPKALRLHRAIVAALAAPVED